MESKDLALMKAIANTASHDNASHAENTAIHLPTVTADDNGKFLCVVNGAWAAVSYPNAEDSTF